MKGSETLTIYEIRYEVKLELVSKINSIKHYKLIKISSYEAKESGMFYTKSHTALTFSFIRDLKIEIIHRLKHHHVLIMHRGF